MKQSHTTQHSIFDFYPEHELGKELKVKDLRQSRRLEFVNRSKRTDLLTT